MAAFLYALGFAVLVGPCFVRSADVVSGIHLVTAISNNLVPKLFQALSPGRENLVFAPFGLASNLAMLLEAAGGDTERELRRALDLPAAADLGEMRLGFKAYFDSFEAAAGDDEAAGSFNMAALRSSDVLSAPYKALLAEYYKANITEAQPSENRTAARAAQVLELRSDSGVMSHWKDYHRLAAFAFLSHVASAPFRRSASRTVQVPMIPQVGLFRSGHLQHLGCEAVELPLEADAASLLLLVPDNPDRLDEAIVKLSALPLPDLVSGLERRETEVSLPQLAVLTSGLDLTPFLRQLGVRAAFDAGGADLARASNAAYARSVQQDAYFATSFVAVNSVGSVAVDAAAKRTKRDSPALIVDRPFLFFLLHRDTQLVLLAGKVQNPTQIP
ncbi:serpin B8-like [Bacillus rossius redtenbacheri]|uniref:serpin B8-like n=1 Tax=Bacillus rossius redtenbacheri TaxID=93214 RepID=UPI002FDED72E